MALAIDIISNKVASKVPVKRHKGNVVLAIHYIREGIQCLYTSVTKWVTLQLQS